MLSEFTQTARDDQPNEDLISGVQTDQAAAQHSKKLPYKIDPILMQKLDEYTSKVDQFIDSWGLDTLQQSKV